VAFFHPKYVSKFSGSNEPLKTAIKLKRSRESFGHRFIEMQKATFNVSETFFFHPVRSLATK
jgi:hypothetical protein